MLSPDETIDQAYGQIRAALEMELLERIKSCSSGFFEGLVIELLLAMGYGGSQEDAGEIRGKSHDGGLMA